MNSSDDIKELAAALVEAQKKIDHARRESTAQTGKDGSRTYRYADLASTWNACREPLTAAGLAIVQTTRLGEGAHVLLTRLVHTSGQWIESETPILNRENNPQSFGSALTYSRRYALAAIVGVASDDDDGQGAMRQGGAPSGDRYPQQQASRAKTSPAANDGPIDPAFVALAAEMKKGVHELGDISLFRDFVGQVDAAKLPPSLLEDVRAEIVVAGVKFAVEEEDLHAWVPQLQEWALSGEPRDRAAHAWEARSDELAARGRAA